MERKGMENFPRTGTENFLLLIYTFFVAQVLALLLEIRMLTETVSIGATAKKYLLLQNLSDEKKKKKKCPPECSTRASPLTNGIASLLQSMLRKICVLTLLL